MTKRRAYLLMKYDAYTCIPCVFVNEIRGSVSYGSFEVNMYISIHVHVHTDGQFVSIWGYELVCQNAMVNLLVIFLGVMSEIWIFKFRVPYSSWKIYGLWHTCCLQPDGLQHCVCRWTPSPSDDNLRRLAKSIHLYSLKKSYQT